MCRCGLAEASFSHGSLTRMDTNKERRICARLNRLRQLASRTAIASRRLRHAKRELTRTFFSGIFSRLFA